jgi:hypothetical protein
VHLGGDVQLTAATPERHGEPRGTGTEVGRRLGGQVHGLPDTGRQHRVEDQAAERPVQPLDQAEGDGLLEQGEGVRELGAGASAPGGLPADERVVRQPAYRLEVGTELAGVGDELLDQGPGSPGPVELVDKTG